MEENNPDQQNETPVKNTVDSRIAAVRDLIFSENMEQYDAQFDDVNNKINELREDTEKNLFETTANLEQRLADLESLMEQKFDALYDDLDKRLAKLNDDKADRRQLGKALEKIAVMLQG
ncbi:magnesium transporter CorA family protein [Flavicella sediminum]|uniref:hypothetical protein n=1 Tax=Flavicella sediminum TaxID=2585141 RepID=UPI001124C30B|nr:hypothetical protein [Flavicella sediminum]